MLTLEIREGKDRYWKYKSYLYHRISLPAFTIWYSSGQKWHEAYLVNGEYHRKVDPAYTDWYPNGQKSNEEYWLNGDRID